MRRVGEDKHRRVDVRVIAATHRDLEDEVDGGQFRRDLYYRLAVVLVQVPPLRDRLDDIPAAGEALREVRWAAATSSCPAR